MPAKILVTSQSGGSRVELIGRSGKQLMTSEVFREPRAKAAIVRALKALIGTQVTVEDNTLPVKAAAVSKRRLNGKAPSTSKTASTRKSSSTSKLPSTRKTASTRKATSSSKAASTRKTSAANASSGTRQTRRGRPRNVG